MNWNAYVDAYCERLVPGFWGEPLNAVSNLAFWLAAWLVWRAWGRQAAAPGTWDIRTLLVTLLLIGAGSFAFHTFATRWAGALDVLFIAVYLHFYLAVYAHRVLGLAWAPGWRRAWRSAWLGIPAFLLLSQLIALLWGQLALLVGSTLLTRATAASGYLAAWTVLLLLVAHAASRRLPCARPMALAAACFAVSLGLRQLDLPLCSDWRWGTHFAWHLLNGTTLGLTSWAMVLALPASGRGLSGKR